MIEIPFVCIRTLNFLCPSLLAVLRLLLCLLLVPLPRQVQPDVLLDAPHRPHLDHVAPAHLARDERARVHIGMVLLERRFRHLEVWNLSYGAKGGYGHTVENFQYGPKEGYGFGCRFNVVPASYPW